MDKINYYPNTAENQIVIRNGSFTIAARGKSADRITDAAVFAISCIGVGILLDILNKASR